VWSIRELIVEEAGREPAYLPSAAEAEGRRVDPDAAAGAEAPVDPDAGSAAIKPTTAANNTLARSVIDDRMPDPPPFREPFAC
jgi:hypothetical protein